MDEDSWRFINTFAPWAAAFATFTAVVVSLHLAHKGSRIELEIHAGVRNVGYVTGGGPIVLLRVGVELKGAENAPQLVCVTITNVGRRSATIHSIWLRPLPWRKRGMRLIPTMPAHSFSSDFPITLEDGKSATYSWPVANLRSDKLLSFVMSSTAFGASSRFG